MTRARIGWFACILISGVLLRAHSQSAEPKATQDWAAYGGDQAKTHYSPLSQINKSNIKQLEVAWSYDTGETGGLQTSPIEVAGVLYGISPSQKVFALNAATGKLKWKFDSGIVGTQPARGLSYWASPDNKDRRIIVGVMNFVYELDADTGQPVASFGDQGRIDLREGLGRDVATGFIALTSPAVVYKDLFIVGGRLPETLPAFAGDVRAYDVRTGKQHWSFHTIPRPGEFGYDTWPKDAWKHTGGANSWGGLTLDEKRGLVFVPTLIFLDKTSHVAVATSLAAMVPVILMGSYRQTRYGAVRWRHAIVIGLASVPTAYLGSVAADRLADVTLRRAFAVLLFGVAVQMAVRALRMPRRGAGVLADEEEVSPDEARTAR